MRRFVAVFALIAVLSGALWLPTGVRLASAAVGSDQELADAKEGLVDASADEAAALKDLAAVRRQKQQLDAEVAKLDTELRAAQAMVDAAQLAADDASAQYLVVRQQLDVARQKVEVARGQLRDQAIGAYISGGVSSAQLDVFSKTDDLREMQVAGVLEDVVAARQQEVVDQFRAAEDDAARLESVAASLQKTATDKLAEARNQAAVVQAARDQQATARASAAAALADEQRTVSDIQARKAQYQARVASLQQTSDSISSLLRTRQSGQAPGGPSLSDPLSVMEMASPFGYRVHPIYGEVRLHAGVDLAGSTGVPIEASAAGVVVFAGSAGGYGNYTVIDHGGQLATTYAHQSRILVSVGDTVDGGQKIGEVGSTGDSTGSHLHFEVRVLGSPVDPCGYLSGC